MTVDVPVALSQVALSLCVLAVSDNLSLHSLLVGLYGSSHQQQRHRAGRPSWLLAGKHHLRLAHLAVGVAR
jgi:hypothetical protein